MVKKRAAVSPIRVLIHGLPKMLHAIVIRALNDVSDIAVSETSDGKGLASAMKSAKPDVIVTVAEAGQPAKLPGEVFEANPRVRVFCIAADGRNAWRRELRISTIGLGDISPEEFVSMIRDSARQPLAAS